MRNIFSSIAMLLMLSVNALAQISAVPNTMQFQARLARPDGTPVPDGTYSVRFSLHTALTGGTEKWNQTHNVTTKTGNFAVLLSGFPAGTFNGDLFLEMKIGNDVPLTPRQPLASVAYAMKSDSVKDGSITSASIADGSISANKLASGTLNSLSWLLGGNSGTTASDFVGTTDNKPLDFRVNNRRAMRYQYAEDTRFPGFELRSINMLGGSDINAIPEGVIGATIAGGGWDYFTATDFPNTVTANFGTVGGGYLNTSGESATIGGGIGNIASGFGATVPGGEGNEAAGTFSFAAGSNAHALHDGSFVWADFSGIGLPFSSTAEHQFLVRAAGGVGINTASPQQNLSVFRGMNLNQADDNIGALTPGLSFGSNSGEGIASKRTAGGNQWGLDFYTAFQNRMSIANNGFVGIGTNAPQGALHVKGFQGALNLEGTSDHVYMQFFPRGFAAGRKAYIGFPAQGSHDLNIANEDGGAVRVIGTFVNNSDARYKQNIAPLDNALDRILNLRGVSYDWRQDMPGQHFTEQRQIGFLAQEVEKVLPELVYTDEKGYKSVAYVNVVPVLVEAIKAQQKQIAAQQEQIAALAEAVRQLQHERK